MQPIRKVGVVGAGIMGSGIAAQIANAGVPVILLDIVPKDSANRNAIAEGAIANLLKVEPAAFMSKRAVRLVTAGNIDDDLGSSRIRALSSVGVPASGNVVKSRPRKIAWHGYRMPPLAMRRVLFPPRSS